MLEALCAFVRGTRDNTDQGPPATDIQATLTVIGRRETGTGGVDLNGVHIPKVRLLDANLSHADLHKANLSGADLSNAKLIGADLSDADLSNADLSNAIVIQSQLDKACSGGGTKLPPGLAVTPCHH